MSLVVSGYNAIALALWLVILGHALYLMITFTMPMTTTPPAIWADSDGVHPGLFDRTHSLLLFTQSMALLEVVFAATKLVKTGILPVALQVAGRLLVLSVALQALGAADILRRQFHSIAARSTESPRGRGPHAATDLWAYSGMLVAWSVADIVRFAYLISKDRTARGGPGAHRAGRSRGEQLLATAKAAVEWARYSLFFVLYPVGIGGEVWIIWMVVRDGTVKREGGRPAEVAVAAWIISYLPAMVVIGRQLMRQRQKVLFGKPKTR